MLKKQKLEIDIELKDLFWEVLRKWRIVVCSMLIGGILLGALSYVDSYRAANAQPTVLLPAKTAEEVMEELNIDELEKVLSAVQLKAQIDAKSQYISESLLMQINPFAKNSISLEYIVDGADALRAIESYTNWIEQGGFLENANQEDAVYVNELVTATSDEAAGMISVQITHVDAVSCEQLAEMVKEAWNEYTIQLINNEVLHTCRLVSDLQSVNVDDDLHTYQDTYLKACVEDQENLKKMKSDMSGDQVKVYLHLERDVFDRGETEEETAENTSTETQSTVSAKASVSMSKIVIGMVLGAVLAVVYIFLRYLLCGTLRVPEEVEKLYDVSLLGTVSETGKKKAAFASVDSWIWKMEHCKDKKRSMEEEIELAAASASIQCQKYDFNQVYISGSSISKVEKETIEGLKKALSRYNITAEVGADITENAESLLAAAKAGNILLVEKKREAAYKNILKCVQTCGTNHIHVLGTIVIENRA